MKITIKITRCNAGLDGVCLERVNRVLHSLILRPVSPD
jgi:hypothetical protein